MVKSEKQAYIAGWLACMAGVDGRYIANIPLQFSYAWHHGFLDAMEAEDEEEPQPEAIGYS